MTETSTNSAPRRSTRISTRAPGDAEVQPTTKTERTAKGKGKAASAKRARGDVQGQGDEAEGGRVKKAKVPSVDGAEPAGRGDDSAQKKLQIDLGGTLPSLVVQNETGDNVDTASLAAEKGVVLFLVPRADTPGCTQQACGFRDIWNEFGTHNFDVYCLSADAPTAQRKWQTKKQLPYQLLSDPTRSLITALGAADANGTKTRRSHFVFEKGGKLVDKKIPVKPAESPRLALEFIKSMAQ